MNGAPEGELFEVTVLTREELLALSDPPLEPVPELSQKVLPALEAAEEPSWNVTFDALTSLRRILVQRPAAVTARSCEKLVPGVERACRNSRSILAKNALFACADLFLKVASKVDLSQAATDSLCSALLDSCASNAPKPLRLTAAQALAQAVDTGPLFKVAPALAVKAAHKNSDVQESAMVFTEKCLTKLASDSGDNAAWAQQAQLDLGVLLPALSVGLNAKSATAKKAAKAACALLSKSLGEQEYNEKVTALEGFTSLQVSAHV